MNPERIRRLLAQGSVLALLAASLAACAAWTDEPPSARDTERMRENERRVCMRQPPGPIEACLRRVEEDYVARQGMRQVEKRDAPDLDETRPVESQAE